MLIVDSLSQYGKSQSEKKLILLNFYYHSIKVHTQEAQNLRQLKSPFQTSLHKIFKNCWEVFTFFQIGSGHTVRGYQQSTYSMYKNSNNT